MPVIGSREAEKGCETETLRDPPPQSVVSINFAGCRLRRMVNENRCFCKDNCLS